MASRRELAGLPKGAEMRALVLGLLRDIATPVNRQQIGEAVASRLDLTQEQVAVREPGPKRGGADSPRSYVSWISEYTCNDLKHIGVCEQPGRGLYQLTEEGWSISLEEVERRNRERSRRLQKRRHERAKKMGDDGQDSPVGGEDEPLPDWRQELLDRMKAMSPTAFEHLAESLLIAAGFHDVNVTGGSGDGGIDGIGTYRPEGLISFQTAFQCKRYQGPVGAGTVRDFRGSFIGRADRGLIITTGYFTDAAKQEATRPGANPIDLIDGEELCEHLKERKLGVRVQLQTIEDVSINHSFFEQLEAAQ